MPKEFVDRDEVSPAQVGSSAEDQRLAQVEAGEVDWRRWGTYLPERQWGTVREDYSADGDAWSSLTYDMARSRAYRWGEDGLLGWTDADCCLCFSTALWNGRDPHLKERLFGLSNGQGNHGEDVKEVYFYLDATPTHSYAKALYRYPQRPFPYEDLVEENRRRGFQEREYELLDTGIFEQHRFFDLTIEYGKQDAEAVLIRLAITNHGPDREKVTVLPTLTFRNTWSWGPIPMEADAAPRLSAAEHATSILADHPTLGRRRLSVIADRQGPGASPAIFTNNDTNPDPPGAPGTATGFYKDGLSRFVVLGQAGAINPQRTGTKAAIPFDLDVGAGETKLVRLRLAPDVGACSAEFGPADFDACLARRASEANEFYATRMPSTLGDDERDVSRQAYAGLLWSKQFYYFNVQQWLTGDPAQAAPPVQRLRGRNAGWRHLSCRDVLSMPDKWEYPWFAAWDLAFHAGPLASIDPAFAKQQLLLLLKEEYLHPNGALPAYEFGFGDANPPVHAMAVMKVYEIERRMTGKGDLAFLESAFLKLLLNFTWWVNRNDLDGRNLFSGGFLGLDNIGLFDRNMKLADGKTLQQADATAWMGLFCASMLDIVFELRATRPQYDGMAVKLLHHYGLITHAINNDMWNEQAGFFFDQVVVEGQAPVNLEVLSIVGLVPLFAVFILRREHLESLPAAVQETLARGRVENPHLAAHIGRVEVEEGPYAGAEFLALVSKHRLKRLLAHLLDEAKFLSPFGIRSVSKSYQSRPFEFTYEGEALKVDYVPGEGNSRAFGGNSNWRGPIWFPINVLILNALDRYHIVYGDDFKVECPAGSGRKLTLREVGREILSRLACLFLKGETGARPCHGDDPRFEEDPRWRDMILFHEYFHGDTGRGLGASHQTGWTALIASCIAKLHEDRCDLEGGPVVRAAGEPRSDKRGSRPASRSHPGGRQRRRRKFSAV